MKADAQIQTASMREKTENMRQRKRKAALAAGLIFLLMLSVAYSLGRLLGKRSPDSQSAGIVDLASGAVMIDLERAVELPDGPPTLWGMADHLEGGCVFVTQLPSLDQIMAQEFVELGPTYEVLVTNQTIVYKDVTSGPAVNGVLQEKVTIGDTDEIERGNLIKVWGEKRGDRIVAEILKYDNHTQLVTPWGPIN